MISKGQVYSNGIDLRFGHNFREALGSYDVVKGKKLAWQGAFQSVHGSFTADTGRAVIY